MAEKQLCYCKLFEHDAESATLVLNGVPICNRVCLQAAEKELLTNKKDTLKVNKPRGWDVT